MRLLYLVCAAAIALLLVIVAMAQFGATCSWYLISSSAHPVVVLLVTGLLGAFMGCFFLLFMITSKPKDLSEDIGD